MKQLLFAASLVTTLISPSFAAPPSTTSDPETSKWYRGLRVPETGGSCCDISDCRPTDLRPDPTNHLLWQAYIAKAIYGPNAPDAWVSIPAERILQKMDNPTGRVVICWYNAMIYCAVLPSLT